MVLQIIYVFLIYMKKQDLSLIKQQWLISHKTNQQTNQPTLWVI